MPHVWKIRYKRWPQLYRLCKNQDEFLKRLAKHYGWTEGQAYMATEWMFRPENYN